jgi:ABC-2 type transport system permease protein
MRFSLQRTISLIKKETYQIFRDSSTFIVAFVLPLMMIFLFGYAMNLDAQRNRLALVVEDSTFEANRLAESFRNSPYFEVMEFKHRKTAEEMIMKGVVRAFVLIPKEFDQKFLETGEAAPIQIITDGSEPNTASLLYNYALGAIQNWQQQYQVSQGVEFKLPMRIENRVWYNPASISKFFLLPGSIATIMTVIGTLLTALVVAREWERGTMEALMSTPVTIFEITIGKMIPYYFLGMCSLFVCVAFSVFVFGVPLRGSILTLMGISSIFLFAALSLGLLLSSISRNQFVAVQLSLYTGFLPAFLLSGFIFEINSMPKGIQWLTYLLHARYYVSSLQTIFLVGDVWGIILKDALWILIIGVVFTVIINKKTRKRLD